MFYNSEQTKDIEDKKTDMKLWKYDLAIAVSFLSHFGALVITRYMTNTLSAITEAAKSIEANPVSRMLQDMFLVNFIFQALFYGSILIIYSGMRKKVMKNDKDWIYLVALVSIILMITVSDFLNDFGVMLGVMFNK